MAKRLTKAEKAIKAAQELAEALAAQVAAQAAQAVQDLPVSKYSELTPAQAKEILDAKAAARSAAALKAHATRKANGTSSNAALKAHATRRNDRAVLEALAAQA